MLPSDHRAWWILFYLLRAVLFLPIAAAAAYAVIRLGIDAAVLLLFFYGFLEDTFGKTWAAAERRRLHRLGLRATD